jgi:hydrogenase-4 component B
MQGILIDKYSPLAINGTLLHMVNHSLLKLLLFLVAGVVYINLHELDLNKIRGFGRGKPLFTFCFLMGVLGIIGLPFWNGYISKTLLHESIIEQIWQYSNHSLASRFFQSIENMFTLAGGLTTAYMLKIFICVCVEKNPFEQEKMKSFNKKYLTKINSVVLLICALALPSLGLLPGRVMTPLAKFGQDFMLGQDLYFTVDFLAWANLKGAFASLLIGVIIYILIIRGCFMSKESSSGNYVYVDLWPKNLDIEKKIYLPLLFKLLPAIGILLAKFMNNIFFIFISVFRYFFNPIKNSCVENKRDSKLIDFFKSRLQGNGIIRIKAIFNSLDYSLLFCISGVVAVLIFILFGAPM